MTRRRIPRLPFWAQALEFRLLVATGVIQARGERLLAEGDVKGREDLKKAALVIGSMLERKPSLADFMHELLDNRSRDGSFLVPVREEAIDTLPRMYPLEFRGSSLIGPPRAIITPFFDLSAEERLQVDAAFEVIMAAIMTHFYPSRVAVIGPRGYDHPGDVVGVSSIPSRRVLRRGISYDSIVHVRAVAARILNSMEHLYGGPRDWATILLVEAVTRVKLTRKEIRVLWENRQGGRQCCSAAMSEFRCLPAARCCSAIKRAMLGTLDFGVYLGSPLSLEDTR
jgi:hypothetical protein